MRVRNRMFALLAMGVWLSLSAACGRYDATGPGESSSPYNDREIAAALAAVSEARGLPRAQIALAWVLTQPGITAPIIGVSRSSQLDDAVTALTIQLSDAELQQLQAPYRPHPVVGF